MKTSTKKVLLEQQILSEGLLLEEIKPEISRQASALIEKFNEFEDRIPAEKSQNIIKALNKAESEIQDFIGSSSIARWMKKSMSLSTTRNPLEEGLVLVTQLASFFNLMKSMKGLLQKKNRLGKEETPISQVLGGRGAKNYVSFRKMLVQALKPGTKQTQGGSSFLSKAAGGLGKLLHFATGGNDSFFGVPVEAMVDEVCDKYTVADITTLGESKVEVNLQYYKNLAKVANFFDKTAAADDPQAELSKLAAASQQQNDAKGETQKLPMAPAQAAQPQKSPKNQSQPRDYAAKLPTPDNIYPDVLKELQGLDKMVDGKKVIDYLQEFMSSDRVKWNAFLNSQVTKALQAKASMPALKNVIKLAMKERTIAEKKLAEFLAKTWKEGKDGNPAARAQQVKNALEVSASKKFAPLIVPAQQPAPKSESLTHRLKRMGVLKA